MKIEIARGIRLSIDGEMVLKVFLCIIWALMLSAYVRGVINHLPFFKDHTDEMMVGLMILTVLLALPVLINKFCLADYLFYAVNVFYYLVSFVFFPENSVYLEENAIQTIFCVYTFYFVGRVVDIDKMYPAFVILSTVCIYMDLYYYLIYAQANRAMGAVTGDDNMWTAYQVLPHVAMVLWATLEKFRIWKAVTLVCGCLFLLSCGTRGPFVCLGFLGIIYFFFYMNFKGAIYVKLGIITSALLLLINLKEVIYQLAKSLTGLQLSTRILEKIVSGELGNDSYRSTLRDKLNYVMEHGDHFWGLGLFGCRNYDITYPHFLPTDLVCTYGYLVGYTLLLLLFALIIWALWVTRGKRAQVFIVFLFSISIIKLLLSSTFLSESYFYMLIGVCVREILLNPRVRHPSLQPADGTQPGTNYQPHCT